MTFDEGERWIFESFFSARFSLSCEYFSGCHMISRFSRHLGLTGWLFLLSFYEHCRSFPHWVFIVVCRSKTRLRTASLFVGPSSKTPETRKWPRTRLKTRDGRSTTKEISFFFSGCCPRFSRLAASPRALLNLKKKRDCSQSNQKRTSNIKRVWQHNIILYLATPSITFISHSPSSLPYHPSLPAERTPLISNYY